MRNHVIDRITQYASVREEIILVCADLGYNVLDKFAKQYPNRFFNVGICEQNMMSVAAGLALEGNTVFTYSIGNFATLRCIEQIRNDVCYHNANVKILAVGGGFAYGELGVSHHATEDIAMMRALPNMRVYVPADETEAVACLEDAFKHDGPAYIRMAKGREMNYHADGISCSITEPIPYLMGERNQICDVTLLSVGTTLSEAIKTEELLREKGLICSIYSMPTVKPIDEEGVLSIAKNCKLMVTIEDHNIIGGLGGAVAEVLTTNYGCAPLIRIGLPDHFSSVVGNQDYIRDFYGISAQNIVKRIFKMLEK